MMSKRGVSSELFIWMFAAIAGALLLLFFILWAGRHADTSSTVEDIEFLRTFEQQLSSLGTTDAISKTFTFPRTLTVHMDCDSFFTDKAQESTSLFLFSPSTLNKQPYTLVGKPWHFPFYADMLYYLIPKDTKVILYYEPSAASFVTSLDIPTSMPVISLPVSSYSVQQLQQELQGYQSATLVFIGRAPNPATLLATIRSPPIKIMEVDLVQSLVTLYPEQKEYPYYGEAHLFGAFFGPAQYACHTTRLIARLHQLAILYQHKATLLQQKVGAGSSCQTFYSQAASLFRTLSTTTESTLLHATTRSLQSINEDLEHNDCPTLY
ncbi:MAG: hypothetical protein Q8L34_01725 [Candidatus Woesearchaeota archaeon]|nr:hypothetical protein [Candidatus Woesearchaeota archaeon]